jgi:hypothetical protein
VSAVAGTFADFRIIKGRKVCALVIEVPLEKADEALRVLGGLPNPSEEKWVGLALLNLLPKPEPAPVEEPKALPAPTKEPRQWGELSLAQQAGIRCQDPAFQRYLREVHRTDRPAADFVRDWCSLTSRAELDANEAAGMVWRELDRNFRRWMQEPSFQ